jgi:hypothetical protein
MAVQALSRDQDRHQDDGENAEDIEPGNGKTKFAAGRHLLGLCHRRLRIHNRAREIANHRWLTRMRDLVSLRQIRLGWMVASVLAHYSGANQPDRKWSTPPDGVAMDPMRFEIDSRPTCSETEFFWRRLDMAAQQCPFAEPTQTGFRYPACRAGFAWRQPGNLCPREATRQSRRCQFATVLPGLMWTGP